jgi:hypothetical protein
MSSATATCDARASRALAQVVDPKRQKPPSELIESARASLRDALENACILERRALLSVAANGSGDKGRKSYDAYIESLNAVDAACAQLMALQGYVFRARVLDQEADVRAIQEAIKKERDAPDNKGKGKGKFYRPTSESAVLAQRLMEAVPLPVDAITPP